MLLQWNKKKILSSSTSHLAFAILGYGSEIIAESMDSSLGLGKVLPSLTMFFFYSL
jgi:hypothetical protein